MRKFGTSKATGRRAVPRAQAPLTVALCAGHSEYSASLIDLSRTGARLAAELLPHQGVDLTFRAEKLRVPALLVWVDGNECGVEFDTPIAAAEVSRIRSLSNFVKSIGETGRAIRPT